MGTMMVWQSLRRWLKVRPHTTKHRRSVSLTLQQLEKRECPTASLSVLDPGTNLVLPANSTPINSFSNWSMSLQAQVSGVAVTSYSWNLSSAADAGSVSGSSTYNVQFTWASFTAAPRTDTISVTANYSGGAITPPHTFFFAPANTPAPCSAPPSSSPSPP